MIRLDLSNEPAWLDLGHGVRLHLHPMTTAMMVASRNDPSVSALDEEATDEESALVFAKALACNAILDWEGVGDCDGNVTHGGPTRRASQRANVSTATFRETKAPSSWIGRSTWKAMKNIRFCESACWEEEL